MRIFMFLLFLILPFAGNASTETNFLPPDEKEALEFLKTSLKAYSADKIKTIIELPNEKGQCQVPTAQYTGDFPLKVFISFSVPASIWIELSRDLEKFNGVFVIRGLPNNSFKELASRLMSLRENGMVAPVQIDPEAFKKYQINSVPSFVLANDKGFDKISGTVSLKYALDQLSEKGAASYD